MHQHYKHAAHRGQKSAKTSDSSYQTHLQQPQGPGSRPEPDLRTRFGEDCDQRSPGGDECAKQPYIPRRQPIKPRSATRQHRPSTWPRPMAANVEDRIISSRKIVIYLHSTAAEPTRCEQPTCLVSMHRTGRERPVWRACYGRGAAALMSPISLVFFPGGGRLHQPLGSAPALPRPALCAAQRERGLR